MTYGKTITRTNVLVNVEKLKPLCTTCKNVSGADAMENNVVVAQKHKHRITTPRYISMRTENWDSNRYLYTKYS